MVVETEYYNFLGIDTNANNDQIKSAYKKKAMKCHPDRFASATDEIKAEKEAEFKKLSTIYQVLSDENKRELYNKFGEKGLEGHLDSSFDPSDILKEMFGMGGMGGAFGNMFNQGRERRVNSIPDIDINYNMTLKDIYLGKKVKVTFIRNNLKSSNISYDDIKCAECNGSGKIMKMRQIGPGMIQQMQSICSTCKGKGINMNNFDKETVKKEIKIPKGIGNGQMVEIENIGNQIPGSNKRTSLKIKIISQSEYRSSSGNKSTTFTKNNNDLYIDYNLELHQAICGGDIEIIHLDGKSKILSIPQNCYNEVIKYENLGLPYFNNNMYGNLYIQTKIRQKIRSDSKRNIIWKIFTNNNKPQQKENSYNGIIYNKEYNKEYNKSENIYNSSDESDFHTNSVNQQCQQQ